MVSSPFATSSSDPLHRLKLLASHLNSTPAQEKLRVVVSRHLGPEAMPLLTTREDIELIVWPKDSRCDRQWLLDNVRGAHGLIVTLVDPVDAEVLDAAGPSLRIVSTMSVGYEHIKLPELAKRGIRLGITPGVLTDAVADISVMLALMAARNAGETYSVVQNSEWPNFSWAPFGFCGPQLSTTPLSPSRTVGFLGFGRIAQATLSRLIPFGVTDCVYTANPRSSNTSSYDTRDSEILKSNPSLKSLRRVSLDDLARESDILFVLAPGGEETYHIINESFLKKMKKHAVLVNTARGTLVDSDALAKALRERWIWAAGVDVVEGEPQVRRDHPLVKEPKCVVIPHIASATFETRNAMARLAAENLLGGLGLSESMPAELTDIAKRL